MPILTLQLQDIAYRINVALDERNAEIQAMVTKAMENAVPHLQAQLDGMVRDAAMRAMSRIVDTTAQLAADRLSEDLQEKLTEAVAEAVRKKIVGRR